VLLINNNDLKFKINLNLNYYIYIYIGIGIYYYYLNLNLKFKISQKLMYYKSKNAYEYISAFSFGYYVFISNVSIKYSSIVIIMKN
jgi:hypothetical protein